MIKLMAAAAAATVAAGLAVATPSTASAAGCTTPWGSGAKSAAPTRVSTFLAVRSGRQPCFDRLVIDLSGPGTGWSVRYVSAVRDQGQGKVIPLAGAGDISVDVQAGATRRITMPAVAGYTTFRQVAWGGSFEGYTTVGLGVRARLPMRAFTLAGPGTQTRLVVDVAHRW